MSGGLLITLAYFLTGGFLVFLAITVSRDNFANRLNRVTGAMLFFAGLGPIFFAFGLMMQQPDQAVSGTVTDFQATAVYQIHTLWELFFPYLLMFAWLFPVDRFRGERPPRFWMLIFVPQIMHLVIMLFFGDINGMIEAVKLDPASEGFATLMLKPFSSIITWVLLLIGAIRSYEREIFGVFDLVYCVAAGYYLESGMQMLREPRLVSRTKIVLWGLRIGVGLFALGLAGQFLFSKHLPAGSQTAAQLLGALIGAGVLAYAIIRHQFLDVQLVFRQSFLYTVAVAILVGLYVVLGVRFKELLTPAVGERAEMVSYAIIIVLLLLFQPISSWLDNVIRSMFMRTRTDYRNVVERFSRQIISVFDPRQLRQNIEETLKTALLVDNVYFVLYDDTIGEYAMLPSDSGSGSTVIERDDLMLRGINLLDSPTNYASLSAYEENSPLAAMLREQKVKVILPMKDSKHLLGFLALTGKAAGYSYSAEDYNLLGVLGNQMVSALTNARLYVESLERVRLQEEVAMARQIQLDLLPAEPPELPCSTVFAQSLPSRTVGGDFYDFIPIDGGVKWGVVIADASGKGMPAALMMAQIQAMIRSEVNNGTAIPAMLRNVNRQVVQASSADKFVTLFYGELDTRTCLFTYANAGHNYPVLVREDGSIELLETGGPILGAFPNLEFGSATVQLRNHDLLFFFTDGLSEAMNADEVEYGEDRIRAFLVDCRNDHPELVVQKIMDDVRKFDPSSPPQDDTTIIALKMIDHSRGPSVR